MCTLSALSEHNRLASWTVNTEGATSVLHLRWEPHTLPPPPPPPPPPPHGAVSGTPGLQQPATHSPDALAPPPERTPAFSPPDVKPFESSGGSAGPWGPEETGFGENVGDGENRESRVRGLSGGVVKVEASSPTCASRSCAQREQSSCSMGARAPGETAELGQGFGSNACQAVKPNSSYSTAASSESDFLDSSVPQAARSGLLGSDDLHSASQTERPSGHALDARVSQDVGSSLTENSFSTSSATTITTTTTTTTSTDKTDNAESEEEEYEEDYESEEDVVTYLPQYPTGAYFPAQFYFNAGTALVCCGCCVSRFPPASFGALWFTPLC